MLRPMLSWLDRALLGNRKPRAARPSPSARPSFEKLETRDVPAYFFTPTTVVAKSMYLQPNGLLLLGTGWGGATGSGFTEWQNSSGYNVYAPGGWNGGSGDTFQLSVDSTGAGTLKMKEGPGSAITLLTGVEDFTVTKSGGVYALTSTGNLMVMGNRYFSTVATNITHIVTNLNGNGDVWGTSTTDQLYDFTQHPGTAYASNVYDFAFNAAGTGVIILTTGSTGKAPTPANGGTEKRINLNTGAVTNLLLDAYLVDDWEAPDLETPIDDYSMTYPPLPNESSVGNGYQGMDIYGSPPPL